MELYIFKEFQNYQKTPSVLLLWIVYIQGLLELGPQNFIRQGWASPSQNVDSSWLEE